MSALKSIFLVIFSISLTQVAAAKPWNIWELREELDQRASSGEMLFCNSEIGKFQITTDNSKHVVMNALIYNASFLGGDTWIENQECETTLDEVLCYYGTGKWIDINLTKMYVTKDRRLVIPGSLKISIFSDEREKIECSIPLK